MKISVNWVKQYTDVKLPIDKLVEKIGAQLGAVEEVIDLGLKYEGIVVAKVVECEKHPNADKLHVCKIDDGKVVKSVERDKNGYVQVVCGAPNVRKGLMVAWLPPGVIVPSSIGKEPFALEVRDLRGSKSNGMLASASELAMGEDHSGILEIDEKVQPGQDFAEAYGLNDYIIDVENKMFTHRPDCFGILGLAREIAGIQDLKFKSPDIYLKRSVSKTKSQGLKASVKNKKLVPRFMGQIFENIEIKPSPIWLQTNLSRVGIRPINNVVDITNYFMYLTGQPMHAYDADKLNSLSLEARSSKKGEKLKLLNGKEIKFEDDSTILITSKDKPVGIGGVMGGSETEVDEKTKKIVLECANFDMYSVRRTSMKYGLFTDAVTRFNKGQSPLQCEAVLAWAARELVKITGAKPGQIVDVKGDIKPPKKVRVSAKFINDRLGLSLNPGEMEELLTNVEFRVERPDNRDELQVTPPFWRTDIDISEDVVEEIGRLYGYDHLPLDLPKRNLIPAKRDELLMLKNQIRDILADAGANEILTYSFVHGNLLANASQDPEHAFKLSNALSPDLQYYRLSLTPNLLEKVYPNLKAGYDEFAVFEIGKTHIKGLKDEIEPAVPKEEERLAFVYAAESKYWQQKQDGPAYYLAQKYALELLGALNIDVTLTSGDQHTPKSNEALSCWAPFELKRSAYIQTAGGEPLGVVGEYKAKVRSSLKLPVSSAGFELNITQILKFMNPPLYQPISRYPWVEQDISLKAPSKISYGEVYGFISQNLSTPQSSQFSLTPVDIYQPKGETAHKHITLRLKIASHEKTLKAEEVNKILDDAAVMAKEKIGVERL
ncbi:MAG TPA: phenylalanine--tRNA ligase subunit beta [Patescibacteria group bacterium]|nr:phenylalanine--tRNA ligase subunit beta [Patescibacteria group bacterium]